MVRIESVWHPEQATMSALVDMTDSSRDNDPNSPVASEDVNSRRQTRTLQRHCPFHKRTDMKWLGPLFSYSMAKHCSVATCSAMSDMAQLKKCWKIAWKGNNLRTELTHQSQLTKIELTIMCSLPQSKWQRLAWWSVRELSLAHRFRKQKRLLSLQEVCNNPRLSSCSGLRCN